MNAWVHASFGTALATGMAVNMTAMHGHDKLMLPMYVGAVIVGSVLPDIDASGEGTAKRYFRHIIAFLFVTAAVILIYAKQKHMINFVQENFVRLLFTHVGIGFVLLLIFTIIGYFSPHRGYTHRWYGALTFCFAWCLIFGWTSTLWFGTGFLAHQYLDMLNKKKVEWLYPLHWDFSCHLCKTNGVLPTVIGSFSVVFASMFVSRLLCVHWFFSSIFNV